MKRKVISLLLTAGLLGTMLTGCGGGSQGTAGDTGSSDASGTESGADSGDAQEGDPYTVAIQIVNVTTDQTDIEMVEEAINEITVPAINCKVDIQNIFIGDLPTTTSMNVVSGDKMDIVCVGRTQKIHDIADDGILLPLDDYLQYAPAYVDLVKEYLEVGKVDGVQLTLPVHPYLARSSGFVYNKDMADEYGVSYWDFNLCRKECLDLGEECFVDVDHLNGKGAQKVTELLARLDGGQVSVDEYFKPWYDEESHM